MGNTLGITQSIVESIPDEMLFEILLRLPIQDIYNTAKLVCHKWYRIIRTHNFIYTHLRRTTYGLLYQDIHGSLVFIAVREGKIETYKPTNYKFRRPIWTSCNGLVMEKDKQDNVCVIANLSTGEDFRLPPYPHHIIGIGYAAASMTYKVFATPGIGGRKGCDVLSVGVDKTWRFISMENLSHPAFYALRSIPLINEGFMHWQIYGNRIVTLNVETEIITETPSPIPRPLWEKRRSTFCFCTGRYLSLLKMIGEIEWEVWEMKPETEEWKKLPDMCLEGRMEGISLIQGNRIEPCGWVKYLEVLALIIKDGYDNCRFVCFYNLIECEISSKKVNIDCHYRLVLHKNSLVSPLGRRMLS